MARGTHWQRVRMWLVRFKHKKTLAFLTKQMHILHKLLTYKGNIFTDWFIKNNKIQWSWLLEMYFLVASIRLDKITNTWRKVAVFKIPCVLLIYMPKRPLAPHLFTQNTHRTTCNLGPCIAWGVQFYFFILPIKWKNSWMFGRSMTAWQRLISTRLRLPL